MARRDRGWAFAFCVVVLRRPLMMLTKQHWRGAENLPPGGYVLAVNHVSEFDPIPVGHYIYDHGRLPRFLGKAEVFKVPVVGAILRSAGQIPVYRKTSDAAQAFSAAVAAVRKGECVVVYVEGTITRDPDLWPMVGKTGAARIALTTGCPVIPLAQWGPQDVLAPYGRRPHLLPRKTMHMLAGPPVDLTSYVGTDLNQSTLRAATATIVDDVTTLLEEIRGAKAPATRFDPKIAGVPDIGNPHRAPKAPPPDPSSPLPEK